MTIENLLPKPTGLLNNNLILLLKDPCSNFSSAYPSSKNHSTDRPKIEMSAWGKHLRTCSNIVNQDLRLLMVAKPLVAIEMKPFITWLDSSTMLALFLKLKNYTIKWLSQLIAIVIFVREPYSIWARFWKVQAMPHPSLPQLKDLLVTILKLNKLLKMINQKPIHFGKLINWFCQMS